MRHQRAPTCLLVSGGLDSGLLLHELLDEGVRVAPLYLRCGLSWEVVELHWLHRFLHAVHSPRLAPLQVVELPLRGVYGSHWSLTGHGIPSAASADAAVYLPGRNVLLLSVAAILCARRHMSTIALGLLKGNPFGDASPRFVAELASSLTRALRCPIRITVPLRHVSKTQLIRSAQAAPLGLTFSCLRPQGLRHCGRCNKCAERSRAFREAKIPDPTIYAR